MDDADGRTARWWAALRRTPVAVWNDDVTDWAAALTYYAVLALFPLLLVILSILGLTMPTARPEVIDRMSQAAPVTVHGDERVLAYAKDSKATVVEAVPEDWETE
ncbi:YhjD/YihY/BrkB family envelope integrity protein, partial [Streptomyces sp. NPDC002172]